MTSTTALRPVSTAPSTPSPSHVPAQALARAPTPSSDPTLTQVVVRAGVESLVGAAIDLVTFPAKVGEDAWETARGAAAAVQVLGQDTSAASLARNEAASTAITGKVALPHGGAFAAVAGNVSVARKEDGYEVGAALSSTGGVAIKGADKAAPGVDLEAGALLGVKVTYAAKDAASADARVGALKTSALEALGRSQLPGGGGLAATLGAFDGELAGAKAVETTIAGTAAAKLSLWKADDMDGVAAEAGLKVEVEHAFSMVVNHNEDGTRSVTFTQRVQVAAEAELGLEHAPLEELKLGMQNLAAANEVAVVQRATFALGEFDMADATDVVAVARAARGPAATEVGVEVKTALGNQQIESKLVVQGGVANALRVAGAALGQGDAKGIAVAGEVVRTAKSGASASVGLGGVVDVEAALERTRELESVKVSDAQAWLGALTKKTVKGAFDWSTALVNAR